MAEPRPASEFRPGCQHTRTGRPGGEWPPANQHTAMQPDCCIAWCLPPWGGRTSAEPELGLGPQHWPSGIPTTVGTPDTPESLNFVQFSKLIIQAGAASQARCASPQGLSALRVRCCRSPTNAAHRSNPHVVALRLRCASFATSSLFRLKPHRCKSAVGRPTPPRHARAPSLPRPRTPGDPAASCRLHDHLCDYLHAHHRDTPPYPSVSLQISLGGREGTRNR